MCFSFLFPLNILGIGEGEVVKLLFYFHIMMLDKYLPFFILDNTVLYCYTVKHWEQVISIKYDWEINEFKPDQQTNLS